MQKLDRIIAGINLRGRRKPDVRVVPVAETEVIRVVPAFFAGFEVRSTTNPVEGN